MGIAYWCLYCIINSIHSGFFCKVCEINVSSLQDHWKSELALAITFLYSRHQRQILFRNSSEPLFFPSHSSQSILFFSYLCEKGMYLYNDGINHFSICILVIPSLITQLVYIIFVTDRFGEIFLSLLKVHILPSWTGAWYNNRLDSFFWRGDFLFLGRDLHRWDQSQIIQREEIELSLHKQLQSIEGDYCQFIS